MMMISKFKILLILTLFLVSCGASEKGTYSNFPEYLNKLQADRQQHDLTTDDKHRLAMDYVFEGSNKMAQNKYAEAVISFQNALSYNDTASIYYLIAKAYDKLFMYDFAIDNLLISLKKDPYNKATMMLLSETLVDMQKPEEALFVLNQIPEKENDTEVMISIANLYERIGEENKSADIYKQMNKKVNDIRILYKLAQIYKTNSNLKNYEEVLKQIYNTTPSAFASNELVQTLLSLKKYYEIDKYLDQFDINLSPDEFAPIMKDIYESYSGIDKDTADFYLSRLLSHIDSRFYYDEQTMLLGGNISNFIKNYDRAIHYYDRAVKVAEGDPYPFIMKGLTYMDMKNYDSAMVVFTSASDSFPKLWSFPYFKGTAFLAKKQTDSALVYTLKSLELDSNSFYALTQTASVYLEKKHYDSSLKYFAKSYEQNQNDPLTNNNYAYLLAEMGQNLEFALKLSKEALKKDPENASYIDTYGWILYKMGNYDSAREYFLKALKITDDNAELYEHLGDTYIKLSDNENAIKSWEKAVSYDPDNKDLKQKIENNRKK